ncbi:MAG: hypothetical protein MUF51_03365 [Vicinamibacteria bacterium]|jgi:hypothetical protein|nr:hypothetical protein [Vicinamibacteria bacterium]
MGDKLVQYYEYAKTKGGIMLQIKLAMKTCMAQPEAAKVQDTPEWIARFYNALTDLLGKDPSIPRL